MSKNKKPLVQDMINGRRLSDGEARRILYETHPEYRAWVDSNINPEYTRAAS